MKASSRFLITIPAAVLVVCAFAGSAFAADYMYASPAAVRTTAPSETVGKVLGATDTIPTFTKLSTSTLRVKKLKGTTTLNLIGRDFSKADAVTINGKKVSRIVLSATKVRVTVPLASLQYKPYTVRLYHNGVLIASRRLTIAKAK